MRLTRLLPVICTEDLSATRDFYRELLGLEVSYDSEWCVQLLSKDGPGLELALHRKGHELIPAAYHDRPGCLYLSIEVNNVDIILNKAEALGLEPLERPGEAGAVHGYDRPRLLLRDPNGVLLEVFTATDPKEAEEAEYLFDQ